MADDQAMTDFGVRPRVHRRQSQDAKPSSWTQGYLAGPIVVGAADVSDAQRRPAVSAIGLTSDAASLLEADDAAAWIPPAFDEAQSFELLSPKEQRSTSLPCFLLVGQTAKDTIN